MERQRGGKSPVYEFLLHSLLFLLRGSRALVLTSECDFIMILHIRYLAVNPPETASNIFMTSLYEKVLSLEFIEALPLVSGESSLFKISRNTHFLQRLRILELRNRVTQYDITPRVTNSKMFIEILLSS